METATTDAALVALILVVLRQLFEMLAKAIPDTETGWRGITRKVFKTLALYIPNKE